MKNLFFTLSGIVLAVSLLYISRFVPYTKITVFSLVPLESEGEQRGTRLYVAGKHIHHSIIGLALILVSLPFIFIFPPLTFFIAGFGAVLIIDQLPYYLSGEWAGGAWELSIIEMIE